MPIGWIYERPDDSNNPLYNNIRTSSKIRPATCGIPDTLKDRIFEPFFTTKPDGEGSGLEFDICKKIIDKYQGKIQFES